MKNPEIHSICMGRMMCISAIVESQWSIQKENLTTLIDILLKIHDSQEFLREAIQTTLVKILKNTTKSVKVFDYIVKKLLVGSESDSTKVDEGSLFKSSSSLSLYLTLRKVYREKF